MAIHHDCVGARRKTEISKNWLLERKEILQKIKDQVRLYLGDEGKDVSLYAKAYKTDIARSWTQAKLSDIDVSLHQVQVAFGGDFHPFAQAQRAHLRIIRNITGDRPIVLGLECFFAQDQEVVDQFLGNKLSEENFLKKINWDVKWGFPWEHYKPLVDFAKKNNIKILALNVEVSARSGESLHFRDQFAAKKIAGTILSEKESLVYVLYGDLHIAEKHLPEAVRNSLPKEISLEMASIYLNSEQIYFQLAEESKEGETEVVRFKDNQFCVLSSPPWVKWQSYLMYLEENFDVDLDGDEDEWEFQVDHTDHVSNLVKMICAGLEVKLRTDAIEVYSLNDPQAIKVTERVLKAREHELAVTLVKNDKSFYIPSEGFFYLSKSTVNHAATLAGQFIHSQLSNRKRMLWNFPEDFLRLIWIEAMSFLLSKLVNPKRKAQTMGDLKKQLQAFDHQDKGREPLLLALDQKMSELLSVYAERQRQKVFKPNEKSSYAHAARFIGEMLGERYFLLYQKRIIDKDGLRGLLEQDLEDKSFDAFYFQQLKSLDKLEAEGVSKDGTMVSQ